LLAVQKDVYSPFLHLIAREAAKAKGVDPVAAKILREWNGQADKELAAPMIAQLTYTHLRQAIGKRAAGRVLTWEGSTGAAVVERLVRERPKEWFADWDATIAAAVRDALEEGRTTQGRNPEEWKHGAFISLELKNPVVSQIPWIGNWFTVGPTPMSGMTTTVKQTSRRLGPSMRFIADLSDWDRSLSNLTLGQSGQVLSGHFKDQWKSYWAGTSFPLRWKSVQGDVLEVQPSTSK
jgi:penicillin G amidase